MEVFEAIKKRRSIKRFLPKPVPERLVRKILEAGTMAPSDCNLQGWNFVLVNDMQLKERLVKEAGTNARILKSPVTVVLCYDKYDPLVGLQSLSAAVQNMLLAATALGVGSCWLASCGNRKKLKEILEIPKETHVASIAVFGYPQYSVKEPPPRKPLELVTHQDKFRQKYHISYSHEPEKWDAGQLSMHQYYYCRKSPFGVQMDIVNEKEAELVKAAIATARRSGGILDLFSYDGSYLGCFPKAKIISLELNEQTARYTAAAAEVHGADARTLVYDAKTSRIPLKDNSVSLATCIFKLERLPSGLAMQLLAEVYRVLKPGGELLIAARKTFSLYSLMYRLIRMMFDDDVRKTAMYSFFGPYRPVKAGKIKKQLQSLGFEVDTEKYFFVPPHAENIYQLYLQYKISAGTCYLNRIKRENRITRLLEKLLKRQGLKKSALGSVSVIRARK